MLFFFAFMLLIHRKKKSSAAELLARVIDTYHTLSKPFSGALYLVSHFFALVRLLDILCLQVVYHCFINLSLPHHLYFS